jgi:hypothetical protein
MDAVAQRRPTGETVKGRGGNWLLIAASLIFVYVLVARLAAKV